MGIPKGAMRKTYLRKSPKWVPKKWKPAYGTIVLMSAQGVSNNDIGDTLGYSSQQICNILNCKEAIKMKERLLENLEKDSLDHVSSKLKMIARRSVENIEKVIFNDSLLENAPLAIFDRSERFLKSVGTLKDPDAEKIRQNNIFIGNDVARILADGLEKANKVIDLHQSQSKSKNEIVVEKPLELKP